MTDIIGTVFDSLGGVITGIVDAIKDAASSLIWQDPTAEVKELSDVLVFGLTFLGVSIATGIAYTVFRMIRK